MARQPGWARSWTDEQLRTAVRDNISLAGVQRALGFRPSGGMHRSLTAHIRRPGLDTAHVTGQSGSRGRPGLNGCRAQPLIDVLVLGSEIGSAGPRRRLISAGLKSALCERCGLDEWQGERLPLELDHINGMPATTAAKTSVF